MVLGIFSSAALAAGSATRTSFADGTWNGTARLHEVIQGATLDASGTFSMKVRRGLVTGTVALQGTGSGQVQGAQASANSSGRYALTGRAPAPRAHGRLQVVATLGGKRQTAAGQIVLTLKFLRGTCDRMSGKIVVAAAASSTETLALPFTATRVRGSGPRC